MIILYKPQTFATKIFNAISLKSITVMLMHVEWKENIQDKEY